MVLLFDIDETLIINDKYPENFKVIKELLKQINKKIIIGICTNRPFDNNVKKIINDYGIKGPVISENGACFYENHNIKINDIANLNEIVKGYLKKYLNFKNKNEKILITEKVNKYNDFITINKKRKMTCTIRLPESLNNEKNMIIDFLRDQQSLKDYLIDKDIYNYLKINISKKNINKISAIEEYFPKKKVIFVTDYESNIFPINNKDIIIYSVGNNKSFNKKCDKVYSEFGIGIEKILRELLYNLNNKNCIYEGRKAMNEYEQISDNCKMLWKENFEVTTEKYTQVYCYIFNDNNQLLIVKNEENDNWTIPGGHPENGETKEETLRREVMEEACVTVKDIKYLGAVEVVENDEIYYQLRYTAKLDKELPFKQEWEISQRLFVNLEDLIKYIKWANGKTFSAQINSARDYWRI